MSLVTQLSRDFGSAIRARGANYFRQGRVRIDVAAATRIEATVRGSSRYQVDLLREGGKIFASCTCPYFDEAPCKHLWAVIMAAEARNLSLANGDDSRVELVTRGVEHFDVDDGPADEDDEYDDDGADESQAERYLPQQRSARVLPRAGRSASPVPGKPTAPDWRRQIARLDAAPPPRLSYGREVWPPTRELLYVIDVANTKSAGGVHLEILFRDLKKDGAWRKPKSRFLPSKLLDLLPDSDDRRILASLAGAAQVYGDPTYGYDARSYYDGDSYSTNTFAFRYRLRNPQPQMLLPALCRTGRCRLRLRPQDEEQQWLPVAWEEDEPWELRLEVRRAPRSEQYETRGALWRGAERMDLTAPVMVLEAGILFVQGRAARFEHHGAFNWIVLLRQHGSLRVPIEQREEFLAQLLRQPRLPPLDLPEELRYEEIAGTPRPRLTVRPEKAIWRRDRLRGELSFEYGAAVIAHDDPSRGIVQTEQRRLLLRDVAAEGAAVQRLEQLGWRWRSDAYADREPKPELQPSRLPHVVRELTAEGWHVEAEGKIYRSPGQLSIHVRSGIDWFELHGAVEFGGTTAQLPDLLAAARRGEDLVRLGDGSFGLLPQEWLKKYGLLAGLGVAHEDHLRFKRTQAGLLDALLAAEPRAQCDAVFTQVRGELQSFAGVRSVDPPAGFSGELRPYQKDGLGWMNFLRQFGFGGCLADDMGLGKTVQVLALLEARRELRGQRNGSAAKRQSKASARSAPSPPSRIGPSLVVVPKSLVFNWLQEAARFAPRLRVLDHTGVLREKGSEHFKDYDVVLTTYGTLRNDAVAFKDVRFDYLILDEAQTIKNADSVSAKAARLLQGDHRLALSGTPIENHLGELWSLFEFLNPGMLGAASVFKSAQGGARNLDEEARRLLARALRPFLLRRTKEQVVRELPPKVEQTLYCELESKQRKLYDELRDHYRDALLRRIESGGIQRAKIQILEALLRLRQAAIHPGLLDKARVAESSAKLDMLLPQLQEVLDEGHKTLVFSQFTGMLAILRERLDRDRVPYEYLDGKTRDRQARVERFQSDPGCKLFLISLKAGGLGLNLTAAQYVFLLDPWWNPAVEAQAIDRAHRIGQTSRVFAYRLIARGTVEEKVLELQKTKRELADAIVGANEGLIRTLRREDLELLLS